MIELNIPGRGVIQLEYLVPDVNGTIVLGQGTNEAGMLQEAVCVLSQESSAIDALMSADLVVPGIHAALELLEHPMRLVASLRK
jgi:soluble P-type ATPase